ncbi:hypothetical protein pb186bvf_017538 [Paramecium bursaria]
MLPMVNKELESQPLVRNMIKSRIGTRNNKSSAQILHETNRSSYKNYKKQHHQQEEVQLQKLCFKGSKKDRKDTPLSFFLTKHTETTLQTKPSTVLDEDQYKDKIDFHSRKLKHDQFSLEHKLLDSFGKFKMEANVCQRPIQTAPRILRQRAVFQDKYFTPQQNMRKIVVVNQLYINTNSLQYIFMYIEDLTVNDKSKFQFFVNSLKNRLKINTTKLYFFLKDGKPVYSHLDIPYNQSLLIFSTYPVYKEVYNPQLQYLEQRCPTEYAETKNAKTLNIKQQNVDEIVNLLVHQKYKSMADSFQLEDAEEEINVGEKYLDSKELKQSYKAIKYNKDFKPILQKMVTNTKPLIQKNFYIEYMQDDLIKQNPKIQELEKIEAWYDDELKKIEFNNELEGDINQVHIEKNDQDEEELNQQIKYVSGLLTPLLDKFLKRKPQIDILQTEDGVEVKFDEDMEIKKKYHPLENVKTLSTKKSFIHNLHSINKELFIQNIPKLLKKTNFSRFELHHTYILYCALQQITSQRYKYYNMDDGLDFKTYSTGIYQIFMQSEQLAQEIFNKIDFNFSGFLNWQEFVDLMVVIRAKTLKEKIDLFIKISDTDGNGNLSADEIFKLSHSEEFLDMLCEYYTRLIFQVVNVDINDEIPLEQIKEVILSGNEESDLLCMFCGADI